MYQKTFRSTSYYLSYDVAGRSAVGIEQWYHADVGEKVRGENGERLWPHTASSCVDWIGELSQCPTYSRRFFWSTVLVERNLIPLECIDWLTELTSLDLRPPLSILRYSCSSPSVCHSLLRLANLLFWRRGVLFFELDDPVEHVSL